MGLLNKLLKSAAEGVKDAVAGKTGDLQYKAENAISNALTNAANKVTDKAAEKAADAISSTIESTIEKAQEKKQEKAEAERELTEAELSEKTKLDPANNRKKINVAPLGNYMNQLAEEWNNQQEAGYVYTISLSDAAVINALGLVKAKYNLSISCSHVGTDPLGVYRGSLAFSYNGDLGGLQTAMLAAYGGISGKMNGWFRNDNFLMRLAPYQSDDENMFIQTLGKPAQSEEEAKLTESMEAAIMAANPSNVASDRGTPLGYWCDWEYRMTEGDMTAEANAFAFFGMAKANATLDNSGHNLKSDGVASFPFIGTFREHHDEIIDGPFPYQLKLYPDGKVTVELYGTNSSTVVLLFRGTWDKIPVSETTVVG